MGWMDGQRHLAGVHHWPQVEAVVRGRRHPVRIGLEQEVDGFEEQHFRQLGQGQPASRVAETRRVRIGAKGSDSAASLPKRFEAFENGLGVVKDRGPGVESQWRVGEQLAVVPAAMGIPPYADHVLGEEAAEAGFGEPTLALLSWEPLRHDVPFELQRRSGCDHVRQQ